MKYFCIENQLSDKHSILSVAVSMELCMNDANLIIYCSDSTYEFVKNFYDFTLNIEHRSVKKELNPFNFIENIIYAIKDIHQGGDEAFFINNECVIMNNLNNLLKDDFTSEVITIKRNIDHENKIVKYPVIAILFRIGNKAVNWLEEYYQTNETIIKNAEEQHNSLSNVDIENMTDEDCKELSLQKTAAMGPLSVVVKEMMYNMVMDKNSPVEEFFDGNTLLDISNFFSKENAWKLNDFKVDEADMKITRNGVKCCICGISPNCMLMDNDYKNHIMFLWSKIQQIIFFNDIRLIIPLNLNDKSIANRIAFGLPKSSLIGNWSRKNTPSFSRAFLHIVLASGYFNAITEKTDDYYIGPFSILYDYKDESLIKPDMKLTNSYVALFNYNNEVLSLLEGKYVYCGLYNPMINLLEKWEKLPAKEKTKDTFHFTDDKLDVYNDSNKYNEYLDELDKHKNSFITDTTCKSHIVDCLALGVVPIIDDECKILEIEDLLNGDDPLEISENCVKYFKDNLTAKALGKRIINAMLAYKQPLPVAVEK